MRIGFVEARDRTNFFAAVSGRLRNHEVFWLVENHAYALRHMTNVTKLRYPRRRDLTTAPLDDPLLQRVAHSDRAVVYFKQSTEHYTWYLRQIEAWFDLVRPDVIFGEASSFQAHITALVAEQRGVPFLNPMSSRYPTGRFAFFRGERMVPFGGDPAPCDEQWLEQTLDDIVHARTSPDYMAIRHSPMRKFFTRARMAFEWLRGERYNLQSPFFFFRRGSARGAAREAWEAMSQSESRGGRPADSSHRPRILYPLQMQPEVNLDVWGREHRDQRVLINELANLAERVGGELWVKPNPKSFHELSPELVSMVGALEGTHLLGHAVKMTEVIDDIDLVVTVSGTIAIERALKGDPVIILLDDYADWIGYPALSSDATIANLDRQTLADAAERGSSVRPIEVLRRLVSTSYPGVISEPSLIPNVLDDVNVTRVASAFEHILTLVETESR
jgi:hypothetical protein